MEFDYDYGIIGGGPAGYTAAIELGRKGKKVILFEKDKIGGTCLNKGCIPTKTLLHLSEMYRAVLNSPEMGLDITINGFDFYKVAEKRDNIVSKIRKSLETAVKNSGVEIVYSNAEIEDEHTIISGENKFRTGKIIFAAGSNPRELGGLKFDHKFVLNSDDVLALNSLPKSVLIVGSGAIGIEWARIYSNFGAKVYIAEYAEHLIPSADIDVSRRIERIFRQNKNIRFSLNDTVSKIEGNIVTLQSGEVVEPDFILVAAGRTPITPGIANVEVIGDSKGEIQLAHYAIHQALSEVADFSFDSALVPSVIYGEPEIAWIGLRGQDCGDDCKSVLFPVTALGKSWCDDSTDGFIKIITINDFIVGAHIVSKEASALIHEILIAMQNKLTVSDLKKICFAHPTYSEGIFEAVCRI